MIRKHPNSLILLTVLLAVLLSLSAFADQTEPGVVPDTVQPEAELFAMINEKRALLPVQPLEWDNELAKVAALRASEIALSYGHTRPNGSTPQTAYKEAGIYFSYAGENLARDLTEPADVFAKWYNKGASRSNLLREEFTHAAIAYFDLPNEDGTVTRFWVMELMKPKNAPVGDIPDTDIHPEEN